MIRDHFPRECADKNGARVGQSVAVTRVPLRVKGLLALGLLACLAIPMHGQAQGESLPDLVPQFPATPRATQTAPVYVDTFTEPGSVLYRFDSVLFNQGGTLDVYRDAATGHVMQAVWAGGVPSVIPDPNAPPPADAAGLTTQDLTSRGATFQFVSGPDHNHFHFEGAARYELLVPGIGTLGAAKVGFCFGDDYGTPPAQYFPYPYTGPGMSWCAVGHPEATFFREGISPASGDLYNSQVQYQWIDVTGLRPGNYTLRGVVNSSHILVESNYSNNTLDVPRTIPGVLAVDARVAKLHRVSVPLRARVVAPLIPARSSSNCFPRSGSSTCLVSDSGHPGLAYSIASTPCFGRVSLRASGSQNATAVYSPGHNLAPVDGFSFVARDARGLVSLPAVVRIGTARVTGPPVACLVSGSVGPDRKARFSYITSGHVPTGAHWGLFINARRDPTAHLTGSTAITQVLDSGKTSFWLELLKDGRPLRPRIQSRQLTLVVPGVAKAAG
jgi:hypothetical protein